MTTSNETPTAPEYQNSKPGEAWNAAYALPVGDAAEAVEPVAWQTRLKPTGAKHWGEWHFGKMTASRHGWDVEERPLFAHPLPKASIEPGVVESAPSDLIGTIRNRVQTGECDLRDVGQLLTGKWDQDAPALLLDHIATLGARVTEIEAENAGLAKDKARLDYLIAFGARISWSRDSEVCNVWIMGECDQEPAEGYPQKIYHDPREAIDAARALQPSQDHLSGRGGGDG
ncbi:hypothetical protein NKJ09_22910 [Mesorhizobium sp. M0189]|uniref:hypothetical protein n=1 Tax=Mesorhizobium sp. M0189 TaxID=2956909 RepID=UPI00333C0BFF